MKAAAGRVLVAVVAAAVASAPSAAGQVELDRVLSRVGNQVITQLDVRRARMLKLVPASAASDADVLRELENHWLMVAEVSRFSVAEADQPALAAERERWRASFDPGVDPASLLEPAGMTQGEIDEWMRHNVRIEAYLRSRFGNVPTAERPAAIATWVRGLRDRAGLR